MYLAQTYTENGREMSVMIHACSKKNVTKAKNALLVISAVFSLVSALR